MSKIINSRSTGLSATARVMFSMPYSKPGAVAIAGRIAAFSIKLDEGLNRWGDKEHLLIIIHRLLK